MLKDNIKSIRKSKGMSQEELALKINVVRQTISKWEQGLSVPDSELLITLANALDTSVSTLLGENVEGKKEDSLSEISQKLEIINMELAKKKDDKRKILRMIFLIICTIIIIGFIILFIIGNSYMEWDYNDTELAILGVGVHTCVWIFVRVAPVVFIGSLMGIFLTRKK